MKNTKAHNVCKQDIIKYVIKTKREVKHQKVVYHTVSAVTFNYRQTFWQGLKSAAEIVRLVTLECWLLVYK